MLFSIVTVCLNAGNALIETVNNIVSQSFTDFEIIIKDGGSTDGSKYKLPDDNRIKVVEKKDTSIYDAMNQAVDECSGEYIIFMNAGDKFYANDTLEKISRCIFSKKEACYYGLCYNRKMDHVNYYPKEISKFTCFRTMICHQSTVYSRQLFLEKKYDCRMKAIADHEFLTWIICKKGIKPVYMDFCVVDYEAGGFCETDALRKQNSLDLREIRMRYYSLTDRLKYAIIIYLTFPKLRGKLATGRFHKLYYSILKRVYK